MYYRGAELVDLLGADYLNVVVGWPPYGIWTNVDAGSILYMQYTNCKHLVACNKAYVSSFIYFS